MSESPLSDKRREAPALKPDNDGFRYVLMWMNHLIAEGEDADGSYLLEWKEFVEACQRHLKNLEPVGRYNGLDIEGWYQEAQRYREGMENWKRTAEAKDAAYVVSLPSHAPLTGSFAPYAVPDTMSPEGRFGIAHNAMAGEIDTPATRVAMKLAKDIYKHANQAGVAPLVFAQEITEAVNESLRLRARMDGAVSKVAEQSLDGLIEAAPAQPGDENYQGDDMVCVGCGSLNQCRTVRYEVPGEAIEYDAECTVCGSREIEEGYNSALHRAIDQRDALQEKLDASAPSSTPRSLTVCEDHKNADWNQPQLEDDACILCRLFYLEAQESLLEEWQQRAKRAEDAIAEVQRPLDAQMARLNETVVRLNEENERLRATKRTVQSG